MKIDANKQRKTVKKRAEFERYAVVDEANVVSRVVYAKLGSPLVISDRHYKVNKNIKVEAGDKLIIKEDKSFEIEPKEETKKPWWRLG